MVIDNLVTEWALKETDATGKPTLVEVTFNGTDFASDRLDRLFINDIVRWLNAEWRVWSIDDRKLTLIRLEN